MKKKSDKEQEIQHLHGLLESTPNLFLASYEKLTVQQDFELRKAVRDAGGGYRVIKNTLAEKAAAGTPAEPILRGLTGMTSMAYTQADPVALAKALTNYARGNEAFRFKAGLVEGRVINIAAIQDLASMPSREEILAKLLFLINAPAQRLVTAISGAGRNLAVVMDQGVKENRFSA